jgi:hypothetical protein
LRFRSVLHFDVDARFLTVSTDAGKVVCLDFGSGGHGPPNTDKAEFFDVLLHPTRFALDDDVHVVVVGPKAVSNVPP